MMIGGFAGFLASYPAGWIADTLGRKWVIVPANLATAVSLLLFGWSGSFTTFLAATTVWSIASSVGASAPSAYAVDCAPPGLHAAAVSTYRMIADAGYVIGPIALGICADHYGAIAALDLAAALMAIVSMAFALFARETLERRAR